MPLPIIAFAAGQAVRIVATSIIRSATSGVLRQVARVAVRGLVKGARAVGRTIAKRIAPLARAVGKKLAQGARAVGKKLAQGARSVKEKIVKSARAIGRKIAKGARAVGKSIAKNARKMAMTVGRMAAKMGGKSAIDDSDEKQQNAEKIKNEEIARSDEEKQNLNSADAQTSSGGSGGQNGGLVVSASILKAISNQIAIIRKTIEGFETTLFKREQSDEAAAIEAKIEKKKEYSIKQKVETKQEDKQSGGFIEKLINTLLFSLFAFFPTIAKFFKESKKTIAALPEKIIKSFKQIVNSISSVIKEYVVNPITKFFKIDVGAALDTLFIFIGDRMEAIMDVPKKLINAASMFANNLVTEAVQQFVEVINAIVANHPILSKIGVIQDIVKAANAKLVELSDKKKTLEGEKDQLEERAAARDKATISSTFDKARAGRVEQYEKEQPPAKPEQAVKVTPISGMDDVKAMVKRHEGVRDKAYEDSVGKWTIGVGHLIGDGSSPGEYAGRTLSPQEIDALFEEDFAKHVRIAEKTPGWNLANDAGKAAMIDLAFNMGYWWKKWPNTAKALTEGNFDAAASGLIQSKWYTQVGDRAKEVVALIKSGKGGGPSTEMAGIAVAEVPAGLGEQIGPKPKPEVSATPQVAVVVPPASPTGGNAGGAKPVPKPNAQQVQRMYAQGLGMPGTA